MNSTIHRGSGVSPVAAILVATVLILSVAPAFAMDPQDFVGDSLSEEELAPYQQAIDEFLSTREAQSLDSITIGELRELGAELSVVSQELQYVRTARIASRFVPGSGHFKIGDGGRGAAFLAGSLAITAGTLVGAYFALPEAVQFDNVDYIDDSFRDIGSAWRGESIGSVLPAFAVLVGGGMLQAILGEIAARDAGRRAQAQIDSGSVQFEPRPYMGPDAQGRLMLGARIGF